MGYERTIAGVFAGAGALLSLYLGVTCNRQELITGGLVVLSGMMAFFSGEKNGMKKKET